MNKYLGLTLALTLSVPAFANEHEHEKGDAHHPCKEIVAACKGAGFYKGGHKESKGLWKNCFEPIMAGQSVAGVSVSPAQVEECKAKKAKHEQKHGEKHAK